MNLNPFYHLRRYRQQAVQISRLSARLFELETQNHTLLKRNEELNNEKQNLLKQLDEFTEPEEDLIVVNRILNKHSRKKRGRNGKH